MTTHFLKINVLGNSMQDYLISATIFLVALLLFAIGRFIVKRRVQRWGEKTATDLDETIIGRIFSSLILLIPIFGLAIAKNQLSINERISSWADKILLVLELVIFFIFLTRLVHALVEWIANEYVKKLREKGRGNLEEEIANAKRFKKQAKEITKMVFAALAVLTILSGVGVNLKAIWASLGIGGIALVVAVQEPLRNLVGRAYIYSTGIFDEGHFIIFNDWAGTVKRITTFRTYLEVFSDMSTVSIPNSDFIKGAVKTYYGRTKFMYKWDLDVPYDIPPQRIQELITALRELLLKKKEVNPENCWVYLERLDRYSKVVRTWFQVRLSSWSESLSYGNHVLHDIQLLFEFMDITFAFPTQTLHVKSENQFEPTAKEPVPVVLPESGTDA